ncbi:unnamed protein product [Closterium sp. NIES-65]|nr:unnamed protein product [Closterium sp. NIES-65]
MTRAPAVHSSAPFAPHSVHSISPPVVSPPTVPIFPPLSLLFSLSLPHPACQSGSSSTPCPCSFNVYVCAAAEHCHVLVSQAEERREAKGSDDNTAATDLVFEVEPDSSLAFSSALIHGAISTRKGGLSGIEPIASAAESPLVSPNTSLSFDAIRIVSPPTVPIFPPLSLLFSLSLPHPACQSGSSSTPCPCSFNVYVCAAAEHCHVLVSQAEERREAKGSDDNTAATDLVFEVEVFSN